MAWEMLYILSAAVDDAVVAAATASITGRRWRPAVHACWSFLRLAARLRTPLPPPPARAGRGLSTCPAVPA